MKLSRYYKMMGRRGENNENIITTNLGLMK